MNVKDLQKIKYKKPKNIVFFSFNKKGELITIEFTKEDFVKLKNKDFLSREIMEIENEYEDDYLEVWII